MAKAKKKEGMHRSRIVSGLARKGAGRPLKWRRPLGDSIVIKAAKPDPQAIGISVIIAHRL